MTGTATEPDAPPADELSDAPPAGTLWYAARQRVLSFPFALRVVLSLAVFSLVVLPFYRLILGSFQEGGPPERGPLTLENYRATFDKSSDIIGNTLQFAVGQTVVPLVIGVLLAWVVTRTDVPWRGLWEFSTLGLYFIPLLAAGTAWSILLGGRNGMLNEIIRALTPWDGFDVYSMSGMIFVQSLYLAASMLVLILYLRSIRHSERYVTVSGKGSLQSPTRLGRWRWVVFAACCGFFFFTMVLPFIAVVVGSLLPYIGRPDTELLAQSSLENYRQLSDNPILWRSLKNSLTLSLGSGLFVMVFGALVAYSVVRFRSRWSRTIDYGASLPLMVPAVVMATSLLYTYITFSLPGGFSIYGTLWIMAMAYVVYFLPVAVRQMTGPVVQLSADLEHASRISGAGNLATMGRIVLPILRPALLGGLILAFITYMREFTLSVLLFRSGTEVITTVMYSFYNNGRLPFVAAISVGLWIAGMLLMVILRFVLKARITF